MTVELDNRYHFTSIALSSRKKYFYFIFAETEKKEKRRKARKIFFR
jgi:hypothetical protein